MADSYITSTLWPLLPQEAVSPTVKKLLQALGWRFEKERDPDGRLAWYCYRSTQDGSQTPDPWTDADRETLTQEPLRSYLPDDEETLEMIDDLMRNWHAISGEDRDMLYEFVGKDAHLFAAILHDPACKDIREMEIKGSSFSDRAEPHAFGGWADLIRRDGIHSIDTYKFLDTKRRELHLQDCDKAAQEIKDDQATSPGNVHYLNVFVENGGPDMGPSRLRVDVTPELGRRIAELARLVNQHKLSKIEVWDGSPEWLMANPDDEGPEDRPSDHQYPMENVTLCVGSDTFWYEGLLSGTDVRVCSEDLAIEGLGINMSQEAPETPINDDDEEGPSP